MVIGRFTSKDAWSKGQVNALSLGANGWICAEGQRVILRTFSVRLPQLRSSGSRIEHSEITQVEDGFEARYEFLIDTWAGRMSVELCVDDVVCDQITLDIRPSDNKLSEAEFDDMLEELSVRSPPLLWGLSQGKTGGSEAGPAPAVVHPIVVDALLPIFERLVRRFMADPPKVRRVTRQLAQFDLTRRADVATLRWLGRRPILLSSLRKRELAGDAQRALIDQPVGIETFDHPVTRYFAHLLGRVTARLDQSAAVLRKRAGPFEDPASEAHAEILAERLDAARGRLNSLAESRVFRRAGREPPAETALQQIGDHPLYSAIQRLGRRLLDPGLGYDVSGNLEAALKRTYDLFELFTLYRLIDEVEATLGAGWRLSKVNLRAMVRREERPSNQASWWFVGPRLETIELRYQQWFSRAKDVEDQRNFGSLSGVNVPDYVLIRRRAGKVVSWVILDAKYRASRQPIDQGLGDIHRYRDALRVRGVRADAAFIIVPRVSDDKAIYAQSAYHSVHRFGVLQLTGQGWSAPIFYALGVLHQPKAASV